MKAGMTINYFSELRGVSGITSDDGSVLALTDLANRTGIHPVALVFQLLEQVYDLENINLFIDGGYHHNTNVKEVVQRLTIISITPNDVLFDLGLSDAPDLHGD